MCLDPSACPTPSPPPTPDPCSLVAQENLNCLNFLKELTFKIDNDSNGSAFNVIGSDVNPYSFATPTTINAGLFSISYNVQGDTQNPVLNVKVQLNQVPSNCTSNGNALTASTGSVNIPLIPIVGPNNYDFNNASYEVPINYYFIQNNPQPYTDCIFQNLTITTQPIDPAYIFCPTPYPDNTYTFTQGICANDIISYASCVDRCDDDDNNCTVSCGATLKQNCASAGCTEDLPYISQQCSTQSVICG